VYFFLFIYHVTKEGDRNLPISEEIRDQSSKVINILLGVRHATNDATGPLLVLSTLRYHSVRLRGRVSFQHRGLHLRLAATTGGIGLRSRLCAPNRGIGPHVSLHLRFC
jgi:hypothetical protein